MCMGQIGILQMLKNTDISDLNASEESIKESLSIFEETNFKTADKKSNRRVILDCLTALAYTNLEWNEWNDAQNYF